MSDAEQRELRGGAAPEQYCPCAQQPVDVGEALARAVVLVEARAESRNLAFDVMEVLDDDRHAFQRPRAAATAGIAQFRLAGLFEGTFEEGIGEGVHFRFDRPRFVSPDGKRAPPGTGCAAGNVPAPPPRSSSRVPDRVSWVLFGSPCSARWYGLCSCRIQPAALFEPRSAGAGPAEHGLRQVRGEGVSSRIRDRVDHVPVILEIDSGRER